VYKKCANFCKNCKNRRVLGAPNPGPRFSILSCPYKLSSPHFQQFAVLLVY